MNYGWSNKLKRLLLPVAGTLIVALTVQAYGPMRQDYVPSRATNIYALNSDLPEVKSISAEALSEPAADGNVLLEVRFARDPQFDRRIGFQLNGREVLLRDDGMGGDKQAADGRFSAVVSLDLSELRANRNRIRGLQRILGRALTSPVFEGREKVAELQVLPSEMESKGPDDVLELKPMGIAEAVDPEKSLVIRDPRVIEDPTRTFNPCTGVGTPMGKWTFGHLIEQMANKAATGIKPNKFVKLWLKHWQKNQEINGRVVPKRSQIKNLILDPWQQASGGPGKPLDLAKAPFRLLAIINRVDLRDTSGSNSRNAGEARFVFAALAPGCFPVQFTVIIEFGIERDGCEAVRAWARQWNDLSSLELGSPEYNAALEAITEQFVPAGKAPSKPNGSALNQLRTNEIALGDPWELREFRIAADGKLKQTTVKNTPDLSLNRTAVLASFINGNEADIVAERHNVPDQFPAGNSFLGGSAPMPFELIFWNNSAGGPMINSREARHKFSLQTCNGCHQGETNTGFLHILPTPFGFPAGLSGFMTGVSVFDPADGSPIRQFNELQRRAADLDQLVNSPCLLESLRKPLRMTH